MQITARKILFFINSLKCLDALPTFLYCLLYCRLQFSIFIRFWLFLCSYFMFCFCFRTFSNLHVYQFSVSSVFSMLFILEFLVLMFSNFLSVTFFIILLMAKYRLLYFNNNFSKPYLIATKN